MSRGKAGTPLDLIGLPKVVCLPESLIPGRYYLFLTLYQSVSIHPAIGNLLVHTMDAQLRLSPGCAAISLGGLYPLQGGFQQ